MRYYYIAAILLVIYVYLDLTKAYNYDLSQKVGSQEKMAKLEFELPKNLTKNFELATNNWGLQDKEEETKKEIKKEIKKELVKTAKYTQPKNKTICVFKECYEFIAIYSENSINYALFYINTKDDKVQFKKIKENQYLSATLRVDNISKKSIRVFNSEDKKDYFLQTGYIDKKEYIQK